MNQITTQQAYEYVKSGEWTFEQFEYWFDEKTSDAYSKGYDESSYNNAMSY